MRIFITGATGYIGRALSRRLVELGHEVRALVRPASHPARAEPLRTLGIALFPGDLADRASMREGMSGSDWVVHAAAELSPHAPPERTRAANVAGSENVASLAYKLGVGRFLAVSSIAAFGGSPPDGSPAREGSLPREPFPSLYSATKRAGELKIREWAARGLRLNVVYPSLVYGPPGKKEGANALLRLLVKRRVPFLVGARRQSSWVHLDDLVEGLLQLIAKAPPGRDYVMAGEVTTLGRAAAEACRLAQVPPPRFDLPAGAARFLLALGRPLYALRGRRPPLSADQLASLDRHWAFDDARARAELDFRPRGIAAGFPPTVEYLLG